MDFPAGYAVRNLPDLNVDVKTGSDLAAPAYYFESAYTQRGQQLVSTSSKAYTQLYWPKKDF